MEPECFTADPKTARFSPLTQTTRTQSTLYLSKIHYNIKLPTYAKDYHFPSDITN
jgi:hypothetical protein